MGTDTQYGYYSVQLHCPQCKNAMSAPFFTNPWVVECLTRGCINCGERFEYGPMGVQLRKIEQDAV